MPGIIGGGGGPPMAGIIEGGGGPLILGGGGGGGSDLSGRWWRGKWPNPLHWSCEGRRVGEDVKIQFSSKRQVFFTESTNSLRLCRKMTPGELVQWCRTNLQYR